MLIARSQPRESWSVANAVIYHEYSIRQLSQEERDQHVEAYGERRLYGMTTPFVLERRSILESPDGRQEHIPVVFDWSEDPGRLARHVMDDAYWKADSLHEWHKAAVAWRASCLALKKEQERIEDRLMGLTRIYNGKYEAELKARRLWTKAQANQADPQVIEKIQAALRSELEQEKESLRAQLEEIKSRLAGLED